MSNKWLSSSSSRCPPPRLERRIAEKNRRNHLKNLYSHLFSLLPNHGSQGESSATSSTLLEQIDETIDYIKSMETKLESYRVKKKRLILELGDGGLMRRVPECVEVRQVGPSENVSTVICGSERNNIFHDSIFVIQQEGGEVLHASFSIVGNNTLFHTFHFQSENWAGDRISRRLNELVHGSHTQAQQYYAGCKVDRKSTSEICQFLGDRLVSYYNKKQTSIATSTAESEYLAADSCCAKLL
ncbi:transcription factor bHLH162-like [Impatiens glandulifera]|uniref:transcription factor bHLH162-like n=1 Tax=Impatiens glandulifera TaxID=253017 RepID=UPI001FB19398|nr:transcription factor bHLH162-like [Impatiens glandulifera]